MSTLQVWLNSVDDDRVFFGFPILVSALPIDCLPVRRKQSNVDFSVLHNVPVFCFVPLVPMPEETHPFCRLNKSEVTFVESHQFAPSGFYRGTQYVDVDCQVTRGSTY